MHAVYGHERHNARARSRGKYNVLGLVNRIVDIDTALSDQAAETLYDVYMVLVQQERHTLAHRLGHRARARHDLSEVGLHLARDIHTVVRRILAVGIDLRALQKRLCRDTAPVEAYSARLGLLNDGHRAAQLRSAYGGHITSRAASYN